MTYTWLKKIPGSLLETDQIPLLGDVPLFPLENFTQELRKSLDNESLTVQLSPFQWRDESSLFSGIGTPKQSLSMVISGLDGKLHWCTSLENLTAFMKDLVSSEITDKDYLAGFHHFLALEAIYALKKSGFDPRLSVQLLQDEEIPTGNMLTVDVKISSFSGRLFIEPALCQSIRKSFAKDIDPFTSPFAEKINAYVGVEIGKTTLTAAELSEIKPGDFVLLDSCTLKPGETKGRVTITYKGRPFFLAKFQEGSIKLSERPLYNEVNMNDEEDFEEEEFEEEEEESGEEALKVAPLPEEKKVTKTPDQIPLNVVVEIARLQMPLKTLMELQPGNLIDLNIHPENGVDLVINGNRIAKGELLQIGDRLGVRIVEK